MVAKSAVGHSSNGKVQGKTMTKSRQNFTSNMEAFTSEVKNQPVQFYTGKTADKDSKINKSF